jgi:hypothetical protein
MSAIETWADIEADALHDTALEEIIQVMPPLPDQTPIRLSDVRKLMILAWLRGASFERTKGKAP